MNITLERTRARLAGCRVLHRVFCDKELVGWMSSPTRVSTNWQLDAIKLTKYGIDLTSRGRTVMRGPKDDIIAMIPEIHRIRKTGVMCVNDQTIYSRREVNAEEWRKGTLVSLQALSEVSGEGYQRIIEDAIRYIEAHS